MPEITYTPDGIPRAPGFINPENPYDTGRPGEKNTEKNGGVGGTPDGWNRETQSWDGTVNNPPGGGGSVFGNPYYGQAEAAMKAQEAADLADTKAQIQQLLIQFGLVPGNFQDKLGALDETIRQLIAKNTESGISQYARLLEGKGDVHRSTINRLSSRGLLRSGAKGYRLRRNTLDFDRTLSDSIAAVLGQAGGLQAGYAGRAYGRQMSLAQALAGIFSRGFGGGGGYSAPQASTQSFAPVFNYQDYSPGAWGTPTIGGGTVGGGQPNFNLGGGSGTSSKKPLLF